MKAVILLSKKFLHNHPKAGKDTDFIQKIKNGYGITCKECRVVERFDGDCCGFIPKKSGDKIHTIRENRSYWKSVFDRRMLLSVRSWSSKPYKRKQEKIIDLDFEKWGIQEITMINGHNGLEAYACDKSIDIDDLAKNDGLSRTDFEAWFAPYFKRKDIFEGVVIHFTKFRY